MAQAFLRARPGRRGRAAPHRPATGLCPLKVVVAVKALACELPATLGIALSRLGVPDIRAEVISRGLVADIGGTTIWRWLSNDAIRPWTYRNWLFPRDPNFAAKAARVLDLYQRIHNRRTLCDDAYVISADEKTSIQARCRCHPSLPPAAARAMRIEHEYDRGGALAYLAAWDVHHARILGRCEATTGIVSFGRLVDQVMALEPYASARRVYWVVDNASSHRGKAAAKRLRESYRNARMIHLPVHACWLNQIEIYFSVVQRKVLTPNDFTDLDEVAARLAAFERRYEQSAKPFEWKFTRSDLNQLLKRLAGKPALAPAA
jgi:hypothetical protein